METVIGVDLGGTKILIGELTLDGEVLSKKLYPSNVTSQKMAVQCIVESLHDFFHTTSLSGHLKGIGIGLVGRVNRQSGEWIEIHPELSESIFVKDLIEKEFQLPCFIGNDVYCATLSEQRYGIGKNYNHFIYMNIGTGIAARLVVDGKILEGAHFDAGEIGHMCVDMNSQVPCICGNHGCVETLASGLGLHNCTMDVIDQYPNSCIKKPVKNQRVSALELFRGYDQHDELCEFILNRAFQAVSATIMNLVRVCDPQAIVLGGSIGGNEWFIQHIKTYLNPQTMRFIKEGIQPCQQDVETIGLKGAGLLVIEGVKD